MRVETVAAGRVRCRYCKKTHKVSSYQSGAFGHSVYCHAFGITASCDAKWVPGTHGKPARQVFRMRGDHMGEKATVRCCTKCGGTGYQALPKRFMVSS